MSPPLRAAHPPSPFRPVSSVAGPGSRSARPGADRCVDCGPLPAAARLRDAAERLAAIVSGIASLSHGAASAYGFAGLKMIMIEMYGGFLLVTAMRDGSILGAIAEDTCEVGLVGYEMATLADRAGDLLTPGAR